jgi:Ricin-type beta-trefoil lectin domain
MDSNKTAAPLCHAAAMRTSVHRLLLCVAAVLGTFAISPAASASAQPNATPSDVVGPYRFKNRFDRVLAVNGGQMSNSTKTVQWADTGSPDQFWHVAYEPNTTPQRFQIVNDKTDSVGRQYCLDVTDGSPAIGAKVQVWMCNSNDQQRWYWGAGKETGYARLINYKSGLVLAVNGGDDGVGRDVVQWTPILGSLDQYWAAVPS